MPTIGPLLARDLGSFAFESLSPFPYYCSTVHVFLLLSYNICKILLGRYANPNPMVSCARSAPIGQHRKWLANRVLPQGQPDYRLGVFGHTTCLPVASIPFGPYRIESLPHYQLASSLQKSQAHFTSLVSSSPYGRLVHAKCCLCTGRFFGLGPINQALPFRNHPGAFFLSASFSFYFGSGLPKCFNFAFYFGSDLPKCSKLTSRFILTEAFFFAKLACAHHSIRNRLNPVVPFRWPLPLIKSRCLVKLL
jgi:hypothetical protein